MNTNKKQSISNLWFTCSFFMLAILYFVFNSSESFGQSFNCAEASHQSEKIICGDEELKTLDSRMAELYKKALKNSSAAEQATLRHEEKGWLINRNDCATRENPKACIKRLYTLRISYLSPIAEGT